MTKMRGARRDGLIDGFCYCGLVLGLVSTAFQGNAYASGAPYPDERMGKLAHSSSRFPEDTTIDQYELLGEDFSCKLVNQAHLRTLASPEYSSVLYNDKRDGTLKPYAEIRVSGRYEYQKYAFSTKWQKLSRALPITIEEQGPIWNSCKRLADDEVSGMQALHFSSIWRSFPYEAPAQLWISPTDGRVLKIRRRFPDKLWRYPFSTILEVFSYDPAKAAAPEQ